MTHDLLRETLNNWGAQGIPVDDERRDRMREPTVERIRTAMRTAGEARRRRNWMTGALLAAVVGVGAAAVVVGLASSFERPSGQESARRDIQSEMVAQAGGRDATVMRGGRVLALERGPVSLTPGDDLHAGRTAAVTLELPVAGHATLAAESEVEIGQANSTDQQFVLRRGTLSVAIPADSPRRHLSIATAHAIVSVVGTEFSVRLLGGGADLATEVSVQRGKVHVRETGGSEHWLTAGAVWRSSPVEKAAAPRKDATDDERANAANKRASVPAPATKAKDTSPSTLAEQNRLYLAALDARNAGDDARTVALLDTLIARYPDSPLRQEAEVERFRALKRQGDTAEATRAARRYLSEYDGGFARDEAEILALPSARADAPAAP